MKGPVYWGPGGGRVVFQLAGTETHHSHAVYWGPAPQSIAQGDNYLQDSQVAKGTVA